MKKYSCYQVLFRMFILLSVESIFYQGAVTAMATVNKITIIFMTDLVIGSLIGLIQPAYILKKIKLRFFVDRTTLTQKEINEWY